MCERDCVQDGHRSRERCRGKQGGKTRTSAVIYKHGLQSVLGEGGGKEEKEKKIVISYTCKWTVCYSLNAVICIQNSKDAIRFSRILTRRRGKTKETTHFQPNYLVSPGSPAELCIHPKDGVNQFTHNKPRLDLGQTSKKGSEREVTNRITSAILCKLSLH